MTNELNLNNELRIGDIVGATNRIVIASWIAICTLEAEYHPYVVWTVTARPEGWSCESGDYCLNIEEAVTMYKKRGGEA
jgi:hypothetical protein